MNLRLRMYQYCYSNLSAIYAKGLYSKPGAIIIMVIMIINYGMVIMIIMAPAKTEYYCGIT